MSRAFRLIPFLLTLATSALAADFVPPPLPPEMKFPENKTVKITDTGALPDGATLCTDAIAKAIDQCAAAGGGIVEFPARMQAPDPSASKPAPAVYLSGPIRMKSNITLQIDDGATLKFSTDHKLFPIVKTRYESVDVMNFSPLIYAYQCENIRITGKGTLDGQGGAWWAWARNNPSRALMQRYVGDRTGQFPLEQRIFGDTNPGYRPCFIEPYECKNVQIDGVTLHASPFWNIHPLYSTNVIVRGVTVFGDGGANTDGCDPDSSHTVLIDQCTFNTGDDCIAIKSGRDGDGIRKNAPCENITIRDCLMKGGHGAVTIGSETSAGIRHVFADRCQVDGPDSAIRLKSTRGRGGGIEDVLVRNMTVTGTKQFAITINMRYTTTPEAPKSETTPVFKDIRIENFTCKSSPQAIEILGLTESRVENVSLKDVAINATRGAKLEFVANLTRDNVKITPATGEAWTMSNVTEAQPATAPAAKP